MTGTVGPLAAAGPALAAAGGETPPTATGWLVAALVPLGCLVPVAWFVAVGEPRDRVVAQNLAQLLGGLALLLAAQGFGRPAYQDLALVLAVLAPAGTLVYARFLGVVPAGRVVRWAALVGVPATVVPLCVAAGPGRQLAKLLVIGALLLGGCLATSSGTQTTAEPEDDGGPGGSGASGAGSGACGEGPVAER